MQSRERLILTGENNDKGFMEEKAFTLDIAMGKIGRQNRKCSGRDFCGERHFCATYKGISSPL